MPLRDVVRERYAVVQKIHPQLLSPLIFPNLFDGQGRPNWLTLGRSLLIIDCISPPSNTLALVHVLMLRALAMLNLLALLHKER